MKGQVEELNQENLQKDERIAYLESLIGKHSNNYETDVQELIDQHQKDKNFLKQQQEQQMQKIKTAATQECTASKRAILKTLNEKYTQST